MRNVSSDILKLQSALTGKTFAEDALEKGMLLPFEGDLSHQCIFLCLWCKSFLWGRSLLKKCVGFHLWH
jgi:hypothetical protein